MLSLALSSFSLWCIHFIQDRQISGHLAISGSCTRENDHLEPYFFRLTEKRIQTVIYRKATIRSCLQFLEKSFSFYRSSFLLPFTQLQCFLESKFGPETSKAISQKGHHCQHARLFRTEILSVIAM